MRNILTAMNYVKSNLIHPKTNIIYDHSAGNNTEWPTAEECKNSTPDPSGYSTGMEDGMISGGIMLDGCVLLYRNTKDAEVKALARQIAEGMINNAMAAESEGFIPRALSPDDGYSHYKDTSVDQYTLFIYGMHIYYNSEICSDEEKLKISEIAQKIAGRAEKNVIPENNYDMLCEDGTPSLWAQIWGDSLQNHMRMRLAMIYAFAWEVSGDVHFLARYHSIRDESIEKSLPMEKYGHLYTVHQMQVSVRLCYDIETDVIYKNKLLNTMKQAAEYMTNQIAVLRDSLKDAGAYNRPQKPFRECERAENKMYKLKQGLTYMSIVREDAGDYWTLQDMAMVSIVNYLVPGAKFNTEASELLHIAFDRIDFEKHQRSLPVHFFDALCRERFI